jgi:poly-beta-1,6-N-acetyl-D-glucosamine synthase
LFLILFTNVGYPILLYLRARFWPKPVRKASIFPTVTILLAAYNEEKNLPGKLANLAALDYPPNLFDIVVVSDGSVDGTDRILDAWQGPRHKSVRLPVHGGKAIALNAGLAKANGEIIVFTDARQSLAPNALNALLENFADPGVGCVSGELVLRESPDSHPTEGLGLYWRLEKSIRYWEGLAGSTVGATGALYAVRNKLLTPLPPDLILDDVCIPLQVARQGQRVVFEQAALAWDDLASSSGHEFRRKVRTLTGNYQLLQFAPWILSPANPLLLEFVCHKLLRLLVPFALLGLLISSAFIAGSFYRIVLVLQLIFYALAVLGTLRLRLGVLSRLSDISLAFTVLNTAACLAFLYFITGRKAVWAQ